MIIFISVFSTLLGCAGPM